MKKGNLTPQRILNDLWLARGAQALLAGVELDLFTHIAEGKRTAREIAGAAKASKRGTQRLLDALVGMEYLNKRASRYGLAPIADRFLVRGRNPYVGDLIYETKLVWENWSRLTDVVRTGRPAESVDTEEQGRNFFPRLVSAIFPLSYAAAGAAVASLSKSARKRIKNILDIAAGAAPWSIAFAVELADARVTVIDYPEVTPIARRFAETFGVGGRFNYIEGNLRQVDFGRELYDLVILGHIIHSEGEKRGKKLISKSYRALKEGGLLLIAEMVPNDSRTGPVIPLLFGLNMLLHTEEGDVFTMREYREWLKGAGFRKATTVEAPAPSPLIVATK